MNAARVLSPTAGRLRARQPGKAIWTALFLLFGPLRLVFLLLYFIPKRCRQLPQWTYRQAISNALLKIWFSFASTVEYQTAFSLEPGPEKERFVVMNPKQPDLYSGVAKDKSIEPSPVGAMWYPNLYEPKVDSKKTVVLHFHGGAYVLGGVRPDEGGWGPHLLAITIDGLVLSPQYRLSSQFKGRFPAALQDSITSYQYLLDHGIPSSRIVISGDSAGGNLALALLRYLEEPFCSLPKPCALLLWSPWLDLAGDPKAMDRHPNSKIDYLPPVLIDWGSRMYRPFFLKVDHPYLSPLKKPFASEVPIFMQHCSAEVLFDEQKAFYLQMMEISSNRLARMETPNAPHDIFYLGQVLGFEKEAKEGADGARSFLEGLSKAS
ncbi:MAG: hypothetical protein Q9172_005526 [Xanthocarpia lactea]